MKLYKYQMKPPAKADTAERLATVKMPLPHRPSLCIYLPISPYPATAASEYSGRHLVFKPLTLPHFLCINNITSQNLETIMYALVEFLGKQYKVEKGASLKVDKIDAEPGSTVNIDKVLLLSSDTVTVGNPYVQGAQVSATVESHGKDKKIVVFKYKPKKDYRLTQGHRQQFSIIKIDDISA